MHWALMNEFDLIARYFTPLAGSEGLSLLDDAALLKPPEGQDLVVSKDVLVEGVHFPSGEYGKEVAQKSLRVNLSDLAAKGAKPWGYWLGLVWPEHVNTEPYISDFSQGLFEVQTAYGLDLFGGDIVRSPGRLMVSITVMGYLPSGQMVYRHGAQPGDMLWLTGSVGAAYLGLQVVLGMIPESAESRQWLHAYHRPEPRLNWAEHLRCHAHAAIDISDGLLADIAHLAKAGDVCIEVGLGTIPLLPSTRKWCESGDLQSRLLTLITAGDDYEIAFCAPPQTQPALFQVAQKINLPLTQIGHVRDGEGVHCYNQAGQRLCIGEAGYSHF